MEEIRKVLLNENTIMINKIKYEWIGGYDVINI